MPFWRAGFVTLIMTVSGVVAVLISQAKARATSRDAEPDGSTLKSLYDSAQRSQKTGDLERAASDYRAFLAKAQGELAAEYAAAGDFTTAAPLFSQALALAPGSPELRLGYAKAALLRGDFERAEALTRAFLQSSSGGFQELAQAHQILGRALHKMNRDREARDEMQKAVDLDPSFANRYDLGVVCLDLDDEKCATSVFQGMVQSFGDEPAVHMQIGLAYGDSDFVPDAIAEFRKVIAEDPRYPGAHYSLAAALLAAGNDAKNVPEAERELNTELTISPNDFLAYAALGKLAANDHKYPQAVTYLRRATSLNPKNPDAFLYLGQMYFDTHQTAQAESALREAIALTKDPSRNRYQIQKAYFILGRILIEQHKPEQAHAEMELAQRYANKALSHDKSELSGLLNNSAASGADNSPDNSTSTASSVSQNIDPATMKGIDAFEKRLTPAIGDSYNNLGVIAATDRNYTEAVGYFERAAAWNPAVEGLDLNWGRAAFMASKFSEAIPPLLRYAKTHPEDAGIRGALAMSQYMTGDYRGCINTLKDVENKLSSIPQMEFVYAESLVKTGQVSAGKARLEALEGAHPEIADVHRALGETLEAEGDWQSAQKELQKAIMLNAGDPQAHYDLGKTDLESGKAAAAIPELETATRLSPEDPTFHRELAAAYDLVSRKDDAKKELAIYERLKNQATPPDKSITADQGRKTAQ
jgi:tetratricopeptide (TPR) repeat protein